MSTTSQQPEAVAAVQDTNFSGAALPSSEPRRRDYGAVSSPLVQEAVSAPKPTTASSRALAPDLLRGLILPLMALDHSALFVGAWLHGTPKQSEAAGTVFTEWNFNSAFISRTLTHLCAPGFFFLMGMGTVYFHRSRSRLGWSRGRMLRHFVVRALALTAVNEVMGQTLMRGRHVLIINIVLIGLAIDYFLTGVLCLMVDDSEKMAAKALDRFGADKDERAPLLSNGTRSAEEQHSSSTSAASARSQSLSFWIHNAVLLASTYITIFWNVWLAPSHGHCAATEGQASTMQTSPIELLALSHTMDTKPSPSPPGSRFGPWFDFWFYSLNNQWVMSGFPPLGWISFCIFGMLYARVMLYKKWTPRAVVAWNLGMAAVLAALFVATRLLHFGNLSEGCLRMPEHLAHPHKNQYLASLKSFFYITKVSIIVQAGHLAVPETLTNPILCCSIHRVHPSSP